MCGLRILRFLALEFPAFHSVHCLGQTHTSLRRLEIGNFCVEGVCNSSENLKLAVVFAQFWPATQEARLVVHRIGNNSAFSIPVLGLGHDMAHKHQRYTE